MDFSCYFFSYRLSPRQSDMKVVDLEESKDLKEPPEKKVTKPTENYSGYEKVSSEFGYVHEFFHDIL